MVDENLEEKLCEKFNTRVEIGEVEVNWLNQVAFNHIVIYDQNEDTLFCARRAMLALEIVPLLQKELIINTIQVIDFQIFAKKDSLPGKTNYAFLQEALMPKHGEDQQRKFINDISLHTVLLRQGTISYDVIDQPKSTQTDLPDGNHLRLTDVSASFAMEVSHITGMTVNLKRLRMKEQCGIALEDLTGHGELTGSSFTMKNLQARLYKCLVDGTHNKVTLRGHLQLANQLAHIQVTSLDVKASPWMDIHARTNLTLSTETLQPTWCEVEFLPSFVANDVLFYIFDHHNFPVPASVMPWLRQAEQLHWSGKFKGESFEKLCFEGDVSTQGDLEIYSKVNLHQPQSAKDTLRISMDGTIASLFYNNHWYKDINLQSIYCEGNIHTNLQSDDPICHLKGYTEVQLRDSGTHVIGTVNVKRLDPYSLHFTETDNLQGIAFSGQTNLNVFIPKTFDFNHLTDTRRLPHGFVHIDSLTIERTSERLHLGNIRLALQKEQSTPVFTFSSSMGNLVGTPTSVIGFVPANPQLAHFLKLSGELGKDLTLQAEWDSVSHAVRCEINMPEWRDEGSTYCLYVKAEGQSHPDSPMPKQLDTEVNLGYSNASHQVEAHLKGVYEPSPTRIRLLPSELSFDGKVFKTTQATLNQKNDHSFLLENLTLLDGERNLTIAGTIGRREDIDLHFLLENWQLDFFLDLLQKGYLDFGGYATGDIHLTARPSLLFETEKLQIDHFSYIGKDLGKNLFTCNFDFDAFKLLIDADVESYPSHHTQIGCDIRIHEERDTIDLKFDLDSLPLDFLKYWVGGALHDLKGHGSGDVHIFGDVDSLNLLGHPMLHNVNFTNEMLGARFYVSDTLNMEANAKGDKGFIGLNNVIVRDKNGQPAYLTLDLEHHHLHDMEYGLDVDIPESGNGFLVFDHPTQQQGDLYWGQLWATGRCQMHGTYNHHRIGLQASPAGKSTFFLSPGEENFTDNAYNFLTFRDKQKLEEDELSMQDLKSKKVEDESDDEPTFIEADLLIHANEHCQMNVKMDPLAEDRLICKGNGDLALHYDPHHDLNLTGNYDITSGSYTVTMKGDFMTKAFQLQSGSRVIFPGSPNDAELDLNAVYNIPSANLRDLDESFATIASLSRTTVPVDCKLNVTGQITAPQIAFDLEIRNTSDEVQALVHNIIGTQEMLNREVFYLLLFSKFYTPEYASTSQRQTGSELTSFASSSLTSQLNNLLGHISDNFTLGTNFRSDKGDFSDMEMDVSVSTRLLNDRLLMTGNLGYRDTENSLNMNNQGRPIIGDFDVEFLINTRGTVRAKAYSHYNDRDYSINNALTTQGIGIILRKDFKQFKDLLKRKQEVAK